jgi:H+/Cl- antiporter ClcA
VAPAPVIELIAFALAIGLFIEQTGTPIASVSLCAIIGMGAMTAGVISAVMAAIIGLIEMTGKLSPSLPLLFSVTCTYVVIYLFSQSSLLVRQLNGRNKNPFVEIKAHDEKYEGVK